MATEAFLSQKGNPCACLLCLLEVYFSKQKITLINTTPHVRNYEYFTRLLNELHTSQRVRVLSVFKKVQISQAQADKELGSPFLSPLTDCVADGISMSARSVKTIKV